MNMKKTIYMIFGLLIAALITIVVFFDSIGNGMSEQYATEQLKTPVEIGQFDTDFFDKHLNVSLIKVKNPLGFENENALSINKFSLKINDFSSDLIVIDELLFDGLEFVLEQNNANVNLVTLIDNLNSTSLVSDDVKGDSTANEKRVKIDKFVVKNIVLKVDSQVFKDNISVADIVINDFGGESGVAISEIGQEVAGKIFQSLKTALQRKGVEAAKEKVKESLINQIKDKVNLKDLKEKIDIDNITKEAKDIFKKFGL